jgi:uncharacterized membrane protein
MFEQTHKSVHSEAIFAKAFVFLFIILMLTVSVNSADASTKSKSVKNSKAEEINCKPSNAKG